MCELEGGRNCIKILKSLINHLKLPCLKNIADNPACALCSTPRWEHLWHLPSRLPSWSNGVHSPLSGETMEIIRVKALKKVLIHTPAFIILIFFITLLSKLRILTSIKGPRKASFKTSWFHCPFNCLPHSDTFHYMAFFFPTNFTGPFFIPMLWV